MAMPALKPRWTAAEVRQLIADNPLQAPRYELVDGELLVTPSPSGAHQYAVSLLWKALYDYLSRNPIGRALTSPLDVELEPEFLVEPDVLVIPPNEARRILTETPVRELLVAAEVLSPSSGRHDRVTKRPRYQQRVPEYWIIDLEARLVERWTPLDERPAILTQRLAWHPAGASEAFGLELPAYFAEIFGEG
jgi:Uma2 family endonuclease